MSININELKCCSSEYVKKNGTEIPYWFSVFEAYMYLKLEEYEKLKRERENEYSNRQDEITPYGESSGKDKIWSQMAQKFEKKMERKDILIVLDEIRELVRGYFKQIICILLVICTIIWIILLVSIFKI